MPWIVLATVIHCMQSHSLHAGGSVGWLLMVDVLWDLLDQRLIATWHMSRCSIYGISTLPYFHQKMSVITRNQRTLELFSDDNKGIVHFRFWSWVVSRESWQGDCYVISWPRVKNWRGCCHGAPCYRNFSFWHVRTLPNKNITCHCYSSHWKVPIWIRTCDEEYPYHRGLM